MRLPRRLRPLLTALGGLALLGYALFGALLMNDWAVAAASGLPLPETIAAMRAAGQPYSALAGVGFAALGALLTAAWAWLVLSPRAALPGWAALSLWAGLLALGAPAFFFGAFGNLNSVGDTFADWHADAAWALEAPLYLASGAGLLLAVGTPLAVLLSAVLTNRRDRGAASAAR